MATMELNFSPLFPQPVPDDQETQSELSYPSSRSRFGQSARSSSRAMMPPRRLDTLREVPSVSMLDESSGDERSRTSRGPPRTKSSSSDSRLPAPRHRRSSGDSGTADNLKNGHQEAAADEEEKEKVEEEEEQPSSPPPAWAAEPRDSAAAQNPLLRRPQWKPTKR